MTCCGIIGALLPSARGHGTPRGMNDDPANMTREERLVARLRENLKRRKAQARELGAKELGIREAGAGESGTGGLSKPQGER